MENISLILVRGWQNGNPFFMRYFYVTKFRDKSPILDIGAGRCDFTKQNICNIFALEIEPEIVDYFSRQGVKIKEGSAYEIPFGDNVFEGVFCCWLFEHLEKPDRAILEIRRVLVKGGYVLIVVPSEKSLRKGFYDDYTHIRPFTKRSLSNLARFAGFSRDCVRYLPWTRGGRLMVHFLGADFAEKYLRCMDMYGRNFGLVNRYALMLEAWK